MTHNIFNWPNMLTLSRIGFAFVIAWLLLQNVLIGHILAAFCFILAAFTDLYDGLLARQMRLVSNFGKIMDPIADKILMLSIFTVLSVIGMVSAWMVIVIAVREIWITVDRLVLIRNGKVIAAERAGKIKTVLQMISIGVILVYLIAEQSSLCSGWFYSTQKAWLSVINVLMVLTVALTVASGVVYFKNKIKA